MAYSAAFRASMTNKMTGRGAVTATALASETGASQATLSRWKRGASSVFEVPKDKPIEKAEPQNWSPEEKFRALMETSGLEGPELGDYLRRHGLHSAQLSALGLASGGHGSAGRL